MKSTMMAVMALAMITASVFAQTGQIDPNIDPYTGRPYFTGPQQTPPLPIMTPWPVPVPGGPVIILPPR
jgi:hypothetical protein